MSCSQPSTGPIVSHFPHCESENETGTNGPLLSMKCALATGSLNKTVLVVSWEDTEVGGHSGSLSCFQGRVLNFLKGAEATGLWGFSMTLMDRSWLDSFSMHWQPLEASVRATQLPTLGHKPCQVSTVNTTCTERQHTGRIYFLMRKMTLFFKLWSYVALSLGHANWESHKECIPSTHIEDKIRLLDAHTPSGPEPRQALEGGCCDPHEHPTSWHR